MAVRINIAIDGPSAAGKSTIAKRVAKTLNYVHLDTGAMYRCIGYKCHQSKIDVHNDDELIALLHNTKIALTPDGKVFLDGNDVSDKIRTNEISKIASDISTLPIVRTDLVLRQQEMAKDKGFVMDGRDIGTVVLKDAEVKIFQTASVEARAMRRSLENKEKGLEANYDLIKKEIEERDYQDTHRQFSPLRKADDAIEIDTSNMSIEEVCDVVLSYVEKALKAR